MSAAVDYFRGPWHIAVYTWRDGIRKKTLVGFLILSLLVIFGSFFLSTFLNQTTSGGQVEAPIDLHSLLDICVATISNFRAGDYHIYIRRRGAQ